MCPPHPTPLWLRILRYPLVRLVLLGYLMLQALGHSNQYMGLVADSPGAKIAVAVGMSFSCWCWRASIASMA